MAEVITFPNAREIVRSALDAALPDGVQAHRKIPAGTANPKPSKFVVVRANGGQRETLVSAAALISIEAYAAHPDDAFELCNLAFGLVQSLEEVISARGFAYPQELPDPTTSQIRFTSTGEVRVRGAAIS